MNTHAAPRAPPAQNPGDATSYEICNVLKPKTMLQTSTHNQNIISAAVSMGRGYKVEQSRHYSIGYRRLYRVLLPRDAMQARPMPSCGVCLSVCLSATFVDSVKTSNHIFNFFHRRLSQTIPVFPYQTS